MRRPSAARSLLPHRLPRRSPLARALAAAFLVAGGPLAGPTLAAGALPTGLQVVSGQATASTSGAQMTVKNTAGAILNWQSFNIGAGNAVWFEQAGATSKVLNRVTGNDPSLILGRLGSNGQVWLLNPNGVLFGAGARVDVAGLVASTLRLNDNDFLAGRYRFAAAEGDAGRVRNEGALVSSFGGQVVLLGTRVENAGEVSAPGGSVSLVAATQVELVDTGLPNLAVRVDKAAGEALNLGRLAADGGRVDVYGAIVNQQGWVQADTLGVDATGQVVLRAADTLTLGEASTTRAVGTAAGATGGAIDLLGAQVALTGAAVADASGQAGGGRIRLGGGLQGQDASVPNAQAVWFGREATLRADATGDVGTGGSLTLWSNAATRAYGTLSARGGRVAGDGGFVETSGGWLDARPAQVDVSSRGGKAGQWLLDPNDITIRDGGTDTSVAGAPDFTSTDDGSVISTATLAAALNAGTSVTVSTGTAGGNAQAGDIVVDGATLLVNPGAAVSLTLTAHRDVLVKSSTIASSGQALSLTLVSAVGGVGAIEVRDSTVTTAGGSVTLRGANDVQAALPGGGLSAPLQLAVGYDPAQQGQPSQLTWAPIGVHVLRSRFTLGSGSFTALGQGVDEAVKFDGTDAANTLVSARSINVQGYGVNASAVLVMAHSDLTATERLELTGRSTNAPGLAVDDGARLTLDAPGNAAAVMALDGAGNELGVAIVDASLIVAGARGTPITATGGSISITGTAQGANPGVALTSGGTLGDSLPAAVSIDAAGASALSFIGTAGTGDAVGIYRVSVLGPANGSTSFSGSGGPVFIEQMNLVAGGSVSFKAPFTDIGYSNLLAGSNALGFAFETTGSGSKGVYLLNSTVLTGGGDVRFGAVQNLSSAALGNTTVAAPWLVAAASHTDYTGLSIPAALWLEGSTLDAGAGRIQGGGAATATAVDFMAGLTLDTSVLKAREITLAGRSESESGINVSLSTLTATRVLSLDAATATAGFTGLGVFNGSRLVLNDATASAGSGLTLSSRHTTRGPALALEGGDLGGNAETSVVVSGGFLHLSGSVDNPTSASSATGVQLTGTSAAPGGLLINATGATEVTVNASNGGTGGMAFRASDINFLGPQASETSTFSITAQGGRLSGGSTQINQSLFSSAGALSLLSDGVSISDSRLAGDNGLQILTDTSSGTARAGAAVTISSSDLTVANAGATLRIAGNGGDAVRGEASVNGGTGIVIANSLLRSQSQLVLNGRGADAGGSGIEFTGSTLQADIALIDGSARVAGHGVFASGGSGTTLKVRRLDITGQSADDPQAASHAGVWLGDAVTLTASGNGDIALLGDSVVLGGVGSSFSASGDAATFTLGSTGSQRLRNATLDFSLGNGTAVSLLADTDALDGGRVRLDGSIVRTGGAPLLVSGVGMLPVNGQGQSLPTNTLVGNGGAGVLLVGSNTLDAGAGTVSLSGVGSVLGSAGVAVVGHTQISGGSVSLLADGGAKGQGLDVGWSGGTYTLDINATSLIVTGLGGTDEASGEALPGIGLVSGSVWSADSIELVSTQALTISGATLQASGDLTATATGRGSNGSLISLLDSTLSAGGTLRLDGTATNGTGFGVSLLDNVQLAAPLVQIAGVGSGSFGISFGAGNVASVVDAGSGRIEITGSAPTGLTGVNLGVGYTLRAAQVQVDSTGGLATPSAATSTGFDISERLDVLLRGGGLLAPGGGLEPAGLALAVATLPATATVSVAAVGGTLSVGGNLDIAPRLQLSSDTSVLLLPLTLLRSTAAGDAVQLTSGGGFVADATASIATPNGRWVLLLDAPSTSVLGTLNPAFTAYDLGAQPWAADASGNLVTPAPGNALGYQVATSAITGALSGTLTQVYDASTTVTLNPATWVLSGLLAGDTLTLTGSSQASMADKNVGTAKPVTIGGGTGFSVTDASGRPVFGYAAPSFTVIVTPATATIVGAQVASRAYDGSNVATMASLGTAQVLAGDVVGVGGTVAALFADKNVGTGKAVAVTGLALTGADAANYVLAAPGGFTADISARSLAVTGLSALNKVYDANAAATLAGTAAIAPIAGDAVALAGTPSASFADKNVGTGKAVTVAGLSLSGADAGNYVLQGPAGLSADVTPAALALTGLAAVNKVYDATATATLAGTAAIAPLAGDTVTLAGTASASFADKNVGTAKGVAVSGLTLAGADAGNYTLQLPAGLAANVTPRTVLLTGMVVADKVYDGSTAGSFSSTGTVTPLAGDVLGLGGTPTATFGSKNASSGGVPSSVTVGGFALTGADAGNYTLSYPSLQSAFITPRPLAISGLGVAGKVYDGNTTAAITSTGTVTPLAGDTVGLAGAAVASFADKNVGAAKAVSVSGFTLSGADAGNYSLVQPAGVTASITAAPLALGGLSAVSRVYDAGTAASFSGTASITPLAGDTVTLAGTALGQFANKNVGTAKAVSLGGLALAGADAGNYTLVLPAYSADITPATLALANLAAAGKTYDGTRSASLTGTLTGVRAGDTVSLALTGLFADANAGAAKAVNWTASTGGADAGNYVLAAATGTVQAPIAAATLTYTASPATATAGQALPALTGTVSGFVAGETLAGATTGTLAWTSTASASSAAGLYAINGGGLAAANYVFVQAAGNATALTLASPATSDPATTATAVVTTTALFSVQLPVTMSTPTQGRVLDVTPALSGAVAGPASTTASAAPASSTSSSVAPAAGGTATAASAGRGNEGTATAASAGRGNEGTATAASAGRGNEGTATAASAGRGNEGAGGTTAPVPAAAGSSAAAAGNANPAALASETLSAITAASAGSGSSNSFDALDWSRLSRDEVQTLLAARARYKQQVFSRGVYRLQQDPSLADVRPCRTEAELETGACVITEALKAAIQAERARIAATQARPADGRRRVKTAALPAIERKLALLIGVNDYRDTAVPALKGAIPDARAVRELLEGRLGYEATVLENPSREAMVRAMNRLALEAGPNDSVIVYYAGHGVLVPVDGVDTGFWLPADVDSGEPGTWLANADIAKLIAAVGARQVMLVSDSCYSGTLAGRERVQVAAGSDAGELLKRRAAVVMSSGGEEPVADEGRQGHSIFAWHFMQALQGLDQWQVGGSLYERVRAAVLRDFPQTPQYGASRTAGHQGNTDYLFERREFDAPAKP